MRQTDATPQQAVEASLIELLDANAEDLMVDSQTRKKTMHAKSHPLIHDEVMNVLP